jgi:hypothetical protein
MKKYNRLVDNNSLSKRRDLLLFISLLVAAGLAYGAYNYTQNSPGRFGSGFDTQDEAKTTSTAPSAQEGFNQKGSTKEPGNTISENGGSASINDNQGEIDNTIDKSNPTISSSGETTVYSPQQNTLISPGATITGSSKLSTVFYRIVDDFSGVISSGRLSVVGGEFSGTLEFDTSATEGRIDLFGAKTDGTEYSNVQIQIRYK